MKVLQHKNFTKALHIIVWLLLLAVPAILLAGKKVFHVPPFFFLVSNLLHIAIFYFNAYYLYPKLLTKTKWPFYLLSLIAVFWISRILKLGYISLFSGYPVNDENQQIIIFPVIPFLIASIIFRLISDRLKHERKEKEARAERLDSELRFLRSQVSPHFLFNMLTNMVALARQKSDLLEPSLIKLSELLRYMIYDSPEGKIALEKEVEYIENYIQLQRLRFGDNIKVEMIVENDCNGCQLEPMLLAPFVENAFKHGVGLVEAPYIFIRLEAHHGELQFLVENNYAKENHSKDQNKGIGIKNVRNRLELLYPGRYRLKLNDDGTVFSVHLNLTL